MAASCAIVLGPWQFKLFQYERLILPLSTSGGYNLYLGNNPWVHEGFGSSWGRPESRTVRKDIIPLRSRKSHTQGYGRTDPRPTTYTTKPHDLWGTVHRKTTHALDLRFLFRSSYPACRLPTAGYRFIFCPRFTSLCGYCPYANVAFTHHPIHSHRHLARLLMAHLLPVLLRFSFSEPHLCQTTLLNSGMPFADKAERGMAYLKNSMAWDSLSYVVLLSATGLAL